MKQRILIIKLGALGDFMLQLGCAIDIHKRYPNAEISFMTTKPMVPFVRQLGFVSDIIVDERPRYNPFAWWRTCKKGIADKKWDFIIDLQASKRTRTKYFPFVRFFSPYPVVWKHLSATGLTVLSVQKKHRFCFGCLTRSQEPFSASYSDLSFIHGSGKNFSLLPEKYVLLIPGCSALHPYKRWPANKYLELAERLDKLNIPCVVLGTKAEQAEIEAVCKAPHSVNFMNKAELADIPDIARKACAVVGNDTGPVHIASLTGTPTIVAFCSRTKASANHFKNVHNFFADDIADILVETIFKQLLDILKDK